MYFFHKGPCWFQRAELFRFCKAIWALEVLIQKMARAMRYQQEPRIETLKRNVRLLPAVVSQL